MAKLLGIDFGGTRTGLALADTTVKVALPFKTLLAENLSDELKKIIETENIDLIVVGWPINFSGQETEQTLEVKKFIEQLSLIFTHTIVKQDERLTTRQAERQGGDDSLAAAYILQSYLDSLHG